MSDKTPPIVPAVFSIGTRPKPYLLAPITRLEALYHTQLKVRGRQPGGKAISLQQNQAYCLPDDEAWARTQTTYDHFTDALAALSAELRRLGTYTLRLNEAGGSKKAPIPSPRP